MGVFDDIRVSRPEERASWFWCPDCGGKVATQRYRWNRPHFNAKADLWAIVDGRDGNDPDYIQGQAQTAQTPQAAKRWYDRLCYGQPSIEWLRKFDGLKG